MFELGTEKSDIQNTSVDLRLCMNYIRILKELQTRNENENEFTDFSPEVVLHRNFFLNCASFPGQNSCDALLLDRVNPLLCKLFLMFSYVFHKSNQF